MQPTLQEGDNVVVSNLFYTPKAGDIVIITKESFSAEPIVKRIIATEGQTVDIDFEKGIVYVDGKALDEPYIAELTHLYEGVAFPVTVPENSVFVMGDNRNESSDSRNPDIGMIDEGCILGKVYCIVIPAGWDFSRFGSVYK